MATVGNLVVNLMGNTAPLQQSLNNAGTMLSSFQSRVKSIMSSAVAMVAGGLGVGKAVQAAQSQIDAEKKLGAVLKATGNAAGVTVKEISDLAGEIQNLTSVSDDSTIGAAALLSTFENIKGDTLKETLKVAADLSALMGTDMAQAATFLGKALADPEEAFARLKKAGVVLSEDQKKNITDLQKSGNMSGAQNALNAAITGKVGGVAEAMNNPLKSLMATMGDVLENLGFMILPTLEKIAKGFSKVFGPLAQEGDKYKAVGTAIAEGLTPAIDVITAAMSVTRDFYRILSEIPDTARAVAFTIAALTAAVILVAGAFKLAAMAKAFFLALSGPKGVAIIVGAIAATAALGLAMNEMHTRMMQENRDKEQSIKTTNAQINGVRKLTDEQKKNLAAHQAYVQKEHARVVAAFKDESMSPREKSAAEILRRQRDVAKALDNLKIPGDQQAGLKAITDRNIINSVTGIHDAIRDAQMEAKILRGEMTEIDKTIQGFADKSVGEQELTLLREALNVREQTKKLMEWENGQMERAKQIISETRSPLEKLRDEFAEIQALQDQGLLSSVQADQARAKAASGMGADINAPGGAAALEQGSQAAFSAIQAAIRSGQKDEIAKQQLDVQKRMVAELEEQTDLRRQQAQAPAGLPAVNIN